MKTNIPRRNPFKNPAFPLSLRRLGLALLLAAAPQFPAVAAQSGLAPAYLVVDLGDLPGSLDYSEAWAVNNAGQVIGGSRSDGSGSYLASFIWDATNGLRDLMPIGSGITDANGINNQGVVVGTSWFGWGQAFQWDTANGMQSLGPGAIAGYPYYGAWAINDGGSIAYGNWSFYGPPGRAYLLSGGTATWIGELFAGGWTYVHGLNNNNEMVGYCGTPGLRNQAWPAGAAVTGRHSIGSQGKKLSAWVSCPGTRIV